MGQFSMEKPLPPGSVLRRNQQRAPPPFGSAPQARGTLAEDPTVAYRGRFSPAGAGNTQRRPRSPRTAQVQPRRRGEHVSGSYPTGNYVGSAPQARGTPTPLRPSGPFHRFSPAGAGNTARAWDAVAVSAVQPRRRGEHEEISAIGGAKDGSAPQARGTRDFAFGDGYYHRFSPAGAGNTPAPRSGRRSSPVQPRRRGGTLIFPRRQPHNARFSPAGAGNTPKFSPGMPSAAVQPRRRGEHTVGERQAWSEIGSAPQARGTRIGEASIGLLDRFSPAGAGNTRPDRPRAPSFPVQPRRRGEHRPVMDQQDINRGSAPQARGTRTDPRRPREIVRFSPAGAGNTTSDPIAGSAAAVQPRRRGEHPAIGANRPASNGSAPQARGTLDRRAVEHRIERFSPAGAGNTLAVAEACTTYSVQPRRRGEHARASAGTVGTVGSAPQARGTRSAHGDPAHFPRFSPAGAGNTSRASPMRAIRTVQPRRRGEHVKGRRS